MQFGFCLFYGFSRCTRLIQQLQVLIKAAVHIVGINHTGVDFRQIAHQIIRRIAIIGRIRRLGGQLLIALCQNQIGRLIKQHFDINDFLCSIVRAMIYALIPCKALHARGLQIVVKLTEQLSKLGADAPVLRQLFKIRHTRARKQLRNVAVHLVHFFKVVGKAVNKQSNRAVAGVQLHRFQHILLHCVRLAVIANHAERLIRSKQSVRAGKRLYNVLVFQHLVHIEGINPLGVKAGQHLVNNDQQIKLLVGGAFNALILLLMRQTQR